VWGVTFIPGKDDLVTGCADAAGRVWSTAEERQVRGLGLGAGVGVGGWACGVVRWLGLVGESEG